MQYEFNGTSIVYEFYFFFLQQKNLKFYFMLEFYIRILFFDMSIFKEFSGNNIFTAKIDKTLLYSRLS